MGKDGEDSAKERSLNTQPAWCVYQGRADWAKIDLLQFAVPRLP